MVVSANLVVIDAGCAIAGIEEDFVLCAVDIEDISVEVEKDEVGEEGMIVEIEGNTEVDDKTTESGWEVGDSTAFSRPAVPL